MKYPSVTLYVCLFIIFLNITIVTTNDCIVMVWLEVVDILCVIPYTIHYQHLLRLYLWQVDFQQEVFMLPFSGSD